ncbi:MAG: hypothetical protein WBC33_06010, partial [Conexibacter sp.]
MIVQDGAALYPLDGGPQGFIIPWTSGAPYYRYYMALLGQVSAEMGRAEDSVRPDAIIVSHGDADHYGGIERIFYEFLARRGTRQPTAQKPFVFNEPFVTQRFDQPFDLMLGVMQLLLGDFSFGERPLPPPPPVSNAFDFAAVPGFMVQGRPAAAVAPEVAYSVDRAPNNTASVLAFHRSRQIIFTGDSPGYLVAPFVARSLSGLADPTVSIFKIPHHGSMRNSLRADALATVPAHAAIQYGLLCILSEPGDWAAIRMPTELRKAGPLAIAHERLVDLYTHAPFRGDPGALRIALRAAVLATFANIDDPRQRAIPWVNVDAGLDVGGLWRVLWQALDTRTRLWNRRIVSSPRSTYRRRPRPQLPPALKPGWLRALDTKVLKEVFLDALAFWELQAFYGGFRADNHVVSANGTYRHPSADTLAAIAAVAARTGARPRVFATDGYAVDLNAIGQRVPGWADAIEIRYLARGGRMVLDMSALDNARDLGALDPLRTTRALDALIDLGALHDQFEHNRGAVIPLRILRGDTFTFKIRERDLYLNLAADGRFAVTSRRQALVLEEAWTLSETRPDPLPFPTSFDDVFLRADPGDPQAWAFTLTRPPAGAGSALRFNQLLGKDLYVSTNPARSFETTDFGEADLAVFEIERQAPAAAVRDGAPRTVTLRAFCEAVGVPTDPPLSCTALLPQLVGPQDDATLAAGITLPAIERVLGWDADLDVSTVTYAEDDRGPLVSVAEVAIVLGTPRTFTIDERTVEIERAAMTLARELPDGLTLTGRLEATDEIQLSQSANVEHPTRTRTLDQYLFDVGMDPAQRPLVTSGTVLSALVGSRPLAEHLLMHAPSFIVAAGIAEWSPDHAASQLETQRTASGCTEVLSARLALQTPAGIATEVEGMTVEVADVALTVLDARLPTMEVALEAVATVARGPPLALRAVLTQDESTFALAFPPDATLADLVQALPGAPDLAALAVPTARGPLGDLQLSAPTIVVRQPSVGAGPYALAEVNGTVAFDDWRSALPAGWSPHDTATPSVRVLSPLDDEHRLLGLDVAFDVTADGARLAAALSASPLPGGQPAWAWTASVVADPV